MAPSDSEAAATGDGRKARGKHALRSSIGANVIDSTLGEKGEEGDRQQQQRKPQAAGSPDAVAAAKAISPAASSAVTEVGGDAYSPDSFDFRMPIVTGTDKLNLQVGCDDIEAQTKSPTSDENDGDVSKCSEGRKAPAGGQSDSPSTVGENSSQRSDTFRDRATRSRASAGRPPLEVRTHTPGGGALAGGAVSSRRYNNGNNFKTPRQSNVAVPSGADASTNSPATDTMLDAIDVGSGIQRLMLMLRSVAGRYGFGSALEFLESRNSLFPQVVHDAFSALFGQDQNHGGDAGDDSDGYVDVEEQSSRRESPDNTSAMGNDTYGEGSVVAEMDNNAALFHDVQIRSFDEVLDPEEQKKMLRKISGEYLDVWCREDCVKLGTATDAKKAGKDQVKQSSLSPVLKKLKELNFFESVTYLRFVAENGVPPKKEYTVRWFGSVGKDNTEDQRNNFRDWWTAVVFTEKFVNLPDTRLKERHLGFALKDKSVRYDDVLKAFNETEPDLEKLRALSKSVQERVEELEQKQTESKTKAKTKTKGKKGKKGKKG